MKPGTVSDLKGYQIPLGKKNNIIARAAREKRPVLVKDVEKMSLNPQNPLLLRLKPKAFVLVPMAVRGRLIGVMLGDNQNDRDFVTEIDRDFLTSFANQIAMALENANLYKRLEDSERKYREIVENVNEGIWVLDVNGIIKFSNRHLREMLGYEDLVDHSIYDLVNEEGKKVLLRVLMENMRERTAREEVVLQQKSGDPVSVLISSVIY
ncbi:MAG: GAF domain-containing protein [Deltaproteobacteria bacterium]|nr:GAF domain-containing protein [Deltaproteobacteria bacterium]MBW1926855.1 GAF domain-containing protein [Deltaproteobacteria bacterium]MBW1966438.1 GAF domain-containing protein [Deltaproteobacteria bacterium]MBW2098127.1 GAF domain-containing protein [Deltaproteobacteria bacterium]